MKFLQNVPSTLSTRSDSYDDRTPYTKKTWQGVRKYLYNRQEGTVCNRNAVSWGLLLGFYTTFLTVVCGLCTLMVFVSVTTIDLVTNGTLFDVASIKHPDYQ